MIAVSRRIALLALLVAAAGHVAGLMRLDLIQPVEMAGGQVGAPEASLGNAFADLAEGTLTGAETTDVIEPAPVEDGVEQVTPPEYTAAAPPAETDTPVATPTDSAALTVPDMEPVPQPTLRATLPPDRLTALAPDNPTVSTPPPDSLSAAEPDQLDLTQSLRPKVRSRAFEERNAPDDPPPAPHETTRTARQSPQAPAPRGNEAQSNTQAGEVDGTDAPAAQRATARASAAQAGNAAVSNYPGQVVRQLQRARRPRMSDRGSATVSFRIASNGGLSAISVARSSGSRELDSAAIQFVRRAAPFPAPPPGAQRFFSVPVTWQ